MAGGFFPDAPLVVGVRAAFGADVTAAPSTWTFTDLTDRWDTSAELVVNDGRSEGAAEGEPCDCTITLFNNDGWLTPFDARSPYWPYVTEGTPFEVDLDAGYGTADLIQCYITSVTPFWPSENSRDSRVVIVAHGVTARLGRPGTPPLRSPSYRAVPLLNPVAYWPLEDGTEAVEAASGLQSGAPMVLSAGTIGFGRGAGLAGSPNVVELASAKGKLTGPVTGTTGVRWGIEWVARFPTEYNGSFTRQPITWYTDGTVAQWDFIADSDSNLITTNNVGTGLGGIATFGPLNDGKVHHFQVDAEQVGGNIEVHGYLDGSPWSLDTVAGTLGQIKSVVINPLEQDYLTDMPAVGHLAVYSTLTPPASTTAALGHVGEEAGFRVARLLTEEGIPYSLDPTQAEEMGIQRADTLLNLLRECERTELGRLTDEGYGFRWRTRRTMWNQTVGLTVDASGGELSGPFTPRVDPQRVRNEIEASRPDGSKAVWRDTTHQLTRGKLADAVSVNPTPTDFIGDPVEDDMLLHHAQARVAIGTVEELRYPGISINLADAPGLIRDWQGLQLGDRINLVGLDRMQHPRGTVDQIVEGRTQVIRGRRDWRVTMRTSPAQALLVAVVEGAGDEALRLDAGPGYVLATAVSASATSLSIASPVGGPLISTSAADYPVEVELGGVPMRIRSVSGASSPQTVTVDRGIAGWDKAIAAGAVLQLRRCARWAF